MAKKNYEYDAKDYILGRLASEVAFILQGKNNPSYQRHKAGGNNVKIINCDKVRVSGNKLKGKIYFHYSGYPSGMKSISLGELLKKDSRRAVRKAIYGMLPKNKLRARVMKNLILEK